MVAATGAVVAGNTGAGVGPAGFEEFVAPGARDESGEIFVM